MPSHTRRDCTMEAPPDITLSGKLICRERFASTIGFLSAALSSAIGLGNLWAFPAQAAQNGGLAFVVVYMLMGLLLAWPLLAMELAVGRYHKSDNYTAIVGLGTSPFHRFLTAPAGVLALAFIVVSTVLYCLVGGWVIEHMVNSASHLAGGGNLIPRDNCTGMELFLLSAVVVSLAGVQKGIARWSQHVLPAMIVLLVLLTALVSQQEGAREGFRQYLSMDVSLAFDRKVMLSSLGQVFFSLSLGGTTMIVYGAYLRSQSNIFRDSYVVVLGDAGFSFLAGLAIAPAIILAGQLGIKDAYQGGELAQGPRLVFDVIPAMLQQLGTMGLLFTLFFFTLVFGAALTSAVSMLEVPVAFLQKHWSLGRKRAVLLCASLVGLSIFPAYVYLDFSLSTVLPFSQRYVQPLLGFLVCVFAGWMWKRSALLQGLAGEHGTRRHRMLIWYIRYICPLLMIVVVMTVW